MEITCKMNYIHVSSTLCALIAHGLEPSSRLSEVFNQKLCTTSPIIFNVFSFFFLKLKKNAFQMTEVSGNLEKVTTWTN